MPLLLSTDLLKGEKPDKTVKLAQNSRLDRPNSGHLLITLVSITKDMIRNEIISFQDIPNVGKAIEKDFILIGLKEPIELINKDPYEMYNQLCTITQKRHDLCVIDVFISAVNYMKGYPPKKWWEYTKERKTKLSGK